MGSEAEVYSSRLSGDLVGVALAAVEVLEAVGSAVAVEVLEVGVLVGAGKGHERIVGMKRDR